MFSCEGAGADVKRRSPQRRLETRLAAFSAAKIVSNMNLDSRQDNICKNQWRCFLKICRPPHMTQPLLIHHQRSSVRGQSFSAPARPLLLSYTVNLRKLFCPNHFIPHHHGNVAAHDKWITACLPAGETANEDITWHQQWLCGGSKRRNEWGGKENTVRRLQRLQFTSAEGGEGDESSN